MSRARQPPLVTGISPNEGTPWTKVTIRGENLGTGPNDLVGEPQLFLLLYEPFMQLNLCLALWIGSLEYLKP